MTAAYLTCRRPPQRNHSGQRRGWVRCEIGFWVWPSRRAKDRFGRAPSLQVPVRSVVGGPSPAPWRARQAAGR